ncbi:MAG: tetratricopeptide repeat protein [Lachnospiraceae bacterium]|nr:tetratricopeptide repeat protein [Lachnospiraceae bacterium]
MEFNRKKYNLLMFLMIVMIVVCLAVFTCFAVCGTRLGLNSFFVLMSQKGEYPTEVEEKAAGIEFIDKYITTYNLANAEYSDGHYEQAMDMYEQVLDDNVTGSIKGRSCINLSLSRTRTIDFDDINERFDDFEDGKETDIMVLADKITKAIQVLEQAKEDLTGNGCVGEEDTLDLSIPEEERNEAEKLASDIDKEIEKLKKMLEKLKQSAGGGGSDDTDNTDNNQGSGSGDSESQPSGGDAREDEVRDFLEEQQTRTKEEQEQSQSDYDERNYWSGEDAGIGDDSANPKPW